MSDPFKFPTESPRSAAFSDAADRLGRVASIVKDQQLARTQSGARAPESEVYVSSPEEAWTRKYMVQCVGPVCTVRPTDEGALLLPRFQPVPAARAGVPANVQTVEITPAPKPAPAPRGRAGAQAEPIGILIGKPVRKRSLLGRVFGR